MKPNVEGHPLPPGFGPGQGGTGTGGSKGMTRALPRIAKQTAQERGGLALGVEGQWEEGVLVSGHFTSSQVNQLESF